MALAAALGLQCGDGSPAAPVPEQEPPPAAAAEPAGCALPPGTWNENCRRLETPQFLASANASLHGQMLEVLRTAERQHAINQGQCRN